jgi:hypothetical protein
MKWPEISEFTATSGRLATDDDIRANRASFILQSDGVRIGRPIDIPLPCFAWYQDKDCDQPKKAVVFQAEEADGKRYFGGWLLDDRTQIVGMEIDFTLLDDTDN